MRGGCCCSSDLQPRQEFKIMPDSLDDSESCLFKTLSENFPPADTDITW